MKTMRMVVMGAIVGVAALLFAGCQPKEEAKAEHPSAKQVEKTATEAAASAEKAATEHPKAAKPKDHPAH
jgi:gas vesicle protein